MKIKINNAALLTLLCLTGHVKGQAISLKNIHASKPTEFMLVACNGATGIAGDEK